jgi:hypothetical protein
MIKHGTISFQEKVYKHGKTSISLSLINGVMKLMRPQFFLNFDKIHKYEQDHVREFNATFDALVEEFPHIFRPLEGLTLTSVSNLLSKNNFASY